MSASHGCGYTYAAFDPEGIAAIESCGQGADRTGQGSGGAYLVQLDVAHHVTARVALEPGANPATLSVDSQGGQILITEYQNPQYRASARPASDWIWAFDGKSLRRSFDRAKGKSALHMVHAWATANHLLLGQVAVDQKSNEITAIPKLLRMLAIKGAIVTIDAMGCQKEIARTIRDRKAALHPGAQGQPRAPLPSRSWRSGRRGTLA